MFDFHFSRDPSMIDRDWKFIKALIGNNHLENTLIRRHSAISRCGTWPQPPSPQITRAPGKLEDFPQLGEKLEALEPREVRRLTVGNYELRYEIDNGVIFILRFWHCRGNRRFEPEK